MRISKNVKFVLAAVLAATEQLEESDLTPWARADFEALGVYYSLRQWLGKRPTPSEQASLSRTLVSMERAGLLVRSNQWDPDPDCRKATHIALTPSGEKLARRIRAQEEKTK